MKNKLFITMSIEYNSYHSAKEWRDYLKDAVSLWDGAFHPNDQFNVKRIKIQKLTHKATSL